MISARYGTALLQKGGVFFCFDSFLRRPFCRGRLFFFQIRPEDAVQQERVNIGRESKAEEEPAARVKRHQLKVLIGHVHRQNRNDSNGQRRRKCMKAKRNAFFGSFPAVLAKAAITGNIYRATMTKRPISASDM